MNEGAIAMQIDGESTRLDDFRIWDQELTKAARREKMFSVLARVLAAIGSIVSTGFMELGVAYAADGSPYRARYGLGERGGRTD